MVFHENRLLADDSHEISYLIFSENLKRCHKICRLPFLGLTSGEQDFGGQQRNKDTRGEQGTQKQFYIFREQRNQAIYFRQINVRGVHFVTITSSICNFLG